MKLASALSPHFDNDVRARGASYYRLGADIIIEVGRECDNDVRARGASYYRLGAVRIKRGNATGVEAGVRGSRVYDVEIAWDGRRLTLFCDCPYYEDVGACKHIWATILAADAQNYFTAITRLNPIDISFDEMHDEDEPDEDPPYYAPIARPTP